MTTTSTATMWGGPLDGAQVDLVDGAYTTSGRDVYPIDTSRGPIVFWAGQPHPGRTAVAATHIDAEAIGPAGDNLLALAHRQSGNPILCTHTTTQTGPLPCGHWHLTATCTTLTPRRPHP